MLNLIIAITGVSMPEKSVPTLMRGAWGVRRLAPGSAAAATAAKDEEGLFGVIGACLNTGGAS